MPALIIAYYRGRADQMGHKRAIKFLKNQGLTFEDTHKVLFGRPPRLP